MRQLTHHSRPKIIPSHVHALTHMRGLPSGRNRHLMCMLVTCLFLSVVAAGPLVGTSFAANIEHCGHVLVGPGGNAIGMGDIRASGSVALARARC